MRTLEVAEETSEDDEDDGNVAWVLGEFVDLSEEQRRQWAPVTTDGALRCGAVFGPSAEPACGSSCPSRPAPASCSMPANTRLGRSRPRIRPDDSSSARAARFEGCRGEAGRHPRIRDSTNQPTAPTSASPTAATARMDASSGGISGLRSRVRAASPPREPARQHEAEHQRGEPSARPDRQPDRRADDDERDEDRELEGTPDRVVVGVARAENEPGDGPAPRRHPGRPKSRPSAQAPAAARFSSRMDSARATSSAVVTRGGMIRITLT